MLFSLLRKAEQQVPRSPGTSFPCAIARAWIYPATHSERLWQPSSVSAWRCLHIPTAGLSSCSEPHTGNVWMYIWDAGPGSHWPMGSILQQSGRTVLCAEVSVLPAFSWLRVQRSLCVGGIWGCCCSVVPLKCTPLYGYFRNSFFVCMYIREKFQPGTIKILAPFIFFELFNYYHY